MICPSFSLIYSHDRTGYIPRLEVFLQQNEDFPLWTKALKSEIGYRMEDDPVDLTHLIRSMQRAEGQADCFITAEWHCDHIDCAWRKYCLEDSREPSVEDGNQDQISADSYKKVVKQNLINNMVIIPRQAENKYKLVDLSTWLLFGKSHNWSSNLH